MIQQNPLISIVIPSLNQGAYIEETICSVLDQDYPHRELIVMDGGSNDNTVKVLRKYSKHLAYWESKHDKGQAAAINKGLKIARGSVFNWINSDDLLVPGALAEVSSFFRNQHINIVCGYTTCFDNEKKITTGSYKMYVGKDISDTIINLKMNQPGTFYRTKIIKELGGVNETFNYVFDDELWIRYLTQYGTKNIMSTYKTIAFFRLHNRSKTVHHGFQNFLNERCSIWNTLIRSNSLSKTLLSFYTVHQNYKPSLWVNTFQGSKKVEAWLIEQKLLGVVIEKDWPTARKGMIYRIKKNWRFTRMNLSLFFKIFILSPLKLV